jgi:hypothetical protein
MDSIMYLCASSVAPANFDIFLSSARAYMALAELLTWLVCVACMGCFALLPFVIFTDRAEFAMQVPALNSIECAWACFGLMMLLLLVVLFHVNTLCAAVMHGGLISQVRVLDVNVWSGRHTHREVVDAVVELALYHENKEDLMHYLSMLKTGVIDAEASKESQRRATSALANAGSMK